MLTKIFPFLLWFKDYDTGKFRIDFIAGLTVALVLIPQSMAYAQLAGLPAYYGLYAAFLPPMIGALFGSSRQLGTGPVAVVSLMTAASLEPLATAGSEAFIMYAVLLAFTVGLFQLVLGVLRLGLIVNLLSHPVVNGFTNAAAIIIGTSQLSKMFGVYVDKAEHTYGTIWRVFEAAFNYTHFPTLFMGVLAIVIMVVLKKVNEKIPNVLVAVVITTVISWAIGFEHNTRVPLESIQSAKIQNTVLEFNSSVEGILEVGEKRSTLTAEIDAAKEAEKVSGSHGISVNMLNLDHQARLLGAEMAEAKQKSHLLRKELRYIKFAGVETAGGKIVFYPKDEVPTGVETDGRTWRIKVGNKLVDESSLLMMGAGAVVGTIPEGLPTLAIPKFDLKVFVKLLPFAVIISLLGFMEAIAIAKAMAAKTGQKLDPNQELIGQGLANMIGSIGQSYPVSGSFSRSAVNIQAGAVSGISSVVTSLIVVVALLFLTPLLYHLPQAVLASVIIMAVIGLINVQGFIHSWKAQWYDGLISVITFVVTLAFAPHLDMGIKVGVVLTVGMFIYKSMKPKVAVLSNAGEKGLMCSDHFQLKECEHIAVIRFDGILFFANASYLEDQVFQIRSEKPNLKHIIIVADGINDMDASGEEALTLLVERIQSAGLGISISGVKENVLGVLERTHALEKIGAENLYADKNKAIEAVFGATHKTVEDKDSCPLYNRVSNEVAAA